MLPDLPWKKEPTVQLGWERLIQEIEARTGLPCDGDTLEEKMEFYDSMVQSNGLSAFGSHVDLALAFLLSTGRLCLEQLHEVIEQQPEAAAYFGDPEVASLEMLALCAQTTFDPLVVSAVSEYARFDYDPDAMTQSGDRLLHLAAESGRIEMVRALLAIGANPNACDREGNSALHRVLLSDMAQLPMREMTKTLLACGASSLAVSGSGMLVEDILRSMGWTGLANAPLAPQPSRGSYRPS